MERKIFMKVFDTRTERDEFAKKLQANGIINHFTQPMSLGKSGGEVHLQKIIVLYVHTDEIK